MASFEENVDEYLQKAQESRHRTFILYEIVGAGSAALTGYAWWQLGGQPPTDFPWLFGVLIAVMFLLFIWAAVAKYKLQNVPEKVLRDLYVAERSLGDSNTLRMALEDSVARAYDSTGGMLAAIQQLVFLMNAVAIFRDLPRQDSKSSEFANHVDGALETVFSQATERAATLRYNNNDYYFVAVFLDDPHGTGLELKHVYGHEAKDKVTGFAETIGSGQMLAVAQGHYGVWKGQNLTAESLSGIDYPVSDKIQFFPEPPKQVSALLRSFVAIPVTSKASPSDVGMVTGVIHVWSSREGHFTGDLNECVHRIRQVQAEPESLAPAYIMRVILDALQLVLSSYLVGMPNGEGATERPEDGKEGE